jgi:hypothetical protein
VSEQDLLLGGGWSQLERIIVFCFSLDLGFFISANWIYLGFGSDIGFFHALMNLI